MVQVLFETYQGLSSIRNIENSNINVGAFYEILNINKDAVIELIDDWGTGDVEGFLMIVAGDPLMVKALDEEDKNFEIFEGALEKLSAEQFNTRKAVYGLVGDIGRYAETFLYHAYDSDNEEAFQFAFDFLDKKCSSNKKDCKLQILCMRERDDRRRGYYRTDSPACPYFSQNSLRRSKYCYMQSPSVWSYINTLIEDNDLSDKEIESIEQEKDKKNKSKSLDQDYCDDFCDKNKTKKLCDREEL